MKKKVKINKKMIAYMVVVLALFAGVIFLISNLNMKENIPEGFFESDDTKIVMNLKPETLPASEDSSVIASQHIVFFCSGDKVTGVKIYYEFDNEDDAKKAYDAFDDHSYSINRKINGKYIIEQAKGDQYTGLTKEQAEQNVERMRAAGVALWYNRSIKKGERNGRL